MSDLIELNSFVQKPRPTRHSFLMKSIAKTTGGDNSQDLNRLLELLNVTNDISLQLKVFSALSAHLMLNKGADIDVAIKCNAVYDKVHFVLSRGLPGKSCEALNFLSTLLYCETEDITSKNKALALYARNMARVSGCLAVMCEMFTSCMMYHDTWKSLCQCTAVACSGCEINQSYCSHLIPVCIKKCNQENIDLLIVLQSLLLNHSRNIQLFLDCNGVSIFTRKLLHYDKCLQLLTTMVQTSNHATTLFHQTNVPADLHDFIRLYGPDSQLGQKAIIILNHISSSAKGKETCKTTLASSDVKMHEDSTEDDAKIRTIDNDFTTHPEDEFEETKVLIQNVMKEVFKLKQSEMQNFKKTDSRLSINVGLRKPTILNHRKLACGRNQINNKAMNARTAKIKNETQMIEGANRNSRLDSNVATELSFKFLQKDNFNVPINREATYNSSIKHKKHVQRKIASERNQINKKAMNARTAKIKNETQMTEGANRNSRLHSNVATELSFTFLQNDNFNVPNVPINREATYNSSSIHRKHVQVQYSESQIDDSLFYDTLSGAKKDNKDTITTSDFTPIFASTPKHATVSVNYTEAMVETQKKIQEHKHNRYRELKLKRQKAKRNQRKDSNITNKSLGARFFSAINDSCTTFVKTVTNIFNTKKSVTESHSSNTNPSVDISCTKDQQQSANSFMNYMKKRDTVLSNNWTGKNTDMSVVSSVANSCKTCNNTEFLKHKLTKDQFLKQTVKKLKLGINLYGCDFKKISKTMWPREAYMTPLVLYKLYRKLLLK